VMQELRLLMGHLFKQPHHKFEFIFRNDDGLGDIWFLALRLCAALGGSRCRTRRRNSPLCRCSLATSFLVVLVEPFLIALIHEIGEAMSEGVLCVFLSRLGRLEVRDRITPPVRWVKGFVVLHKSGIIRDWDVGVLLFRRPIPGTTGAAGSCMALRGS
jgi:hypothetical protein